MITQTIRPLTLLYSSRIHRSPSLSLSIDYKFSEKKFRKRNKKDDILEKR